MAGGQRFTRLHILDAISHHHRCKADDDAADIQSVEIRPIIAKTPTSILINNNAIADGSSRPTMGSAVL
jgi:hypothetical protein